MISVDFWETLETRAVEKSWWTAVTFHMTRFHEMAIVKESQLFQFHKTGRER